MEHATQDEIISAVTEVLHIDDMLLIHLHTFVADGFLPIHHDDVDIIEKCLRLAYVLKRTTKIEVTP